MRSLVNFPWKEMMDEWKIFVLKMFFHQHEILEGFFLVHLSRRLKWAFLIEICPLSVVVVHFSHFYLLLQSHWASFNRTWHKASLGEEDSSWRYKLETYNSQKLDFFSLSLSLNQRVSIIIALQKSVCYLEMFLRWAMWPMGLFFFLVTFNRNIKVRRKYNNDSRLLQ